MIIAVVDSGIDIRYEREYCPKLRSKWSTYDNSPNCVDKNGHGTNCLSLISLLAPDSEFIVIKCLNDEGRGSSEQLYRALKFLSECDVDIVSMSVSVDVMDSWCDKISEICSVLKKQSKILLAAVANGQEESFPANLETVFGVKGSIFRGDKDFFYDKTGRTNLFCDILPVCVPGLSGEKVLFSGNSKACCVAAGLIANYFDSVRPENKMEAIEALLSNCSASNIINAEPCFPIPDISPKSELQIREYKFNAEAVVDDICETMSTTRQELQSKKLFLCNGFSIAAISQILNKLLLREGVRVPLYGMNYRHFEWLECFLNYIDRFAGV